MERMKLKFLPMDLTKIHIMSRDIEVDREWMDKYRIRHIYNKIEGMDIDGMANGVVRSLVKDRLRLNSDVLIGQVYSERGNCMMVEGGVKETRSGGHVVITTIFHFEDEYSMTLFILKYPHKIWDHVKDLYIILN